jgi:hypothetical protein
MDSRIKLIGFILIFTVSIVISYSLEKFVFTDESESVWEFFIAMPIFLFTSICGYFIRNIKELAVHAFFFTIALLIFVFTTMSFEQKHGGNELAVLFRNQESVIRVFTALVGIYTAIFLLSAFGMLLSYLYKHIFSHQKT